MSKTIRILICDDDPIVHQSLSLYLDNEDFLHDSAYDGRQALDMIKKEHYDLMLLDQMMPGMTGMEVCQAVRKDSQLPIIMLTARDTEDDRVRGLDTGADDYLTKPFSPRELLARVAAVMRRIRPALAGETIAVGDLSLDPVAHRVVRRGETVRLGPTEYRMLKFFMENPGRVFSRNQLLDGVWGTESDIELRTVDVHIRRLRKAIEIDGAADPIRTVRSAGYSIEPA